MSSIIHMFRQGNTMAIAIPRPFRNALQLTHGSELHIELIDGRLVITPLERAIEERIARRRAGLPFEKPPEVG